MYSTDDEVGTKRKISTLNRILATEGYDVAELWTNIDDVIIKTILSALPMLKHNYNASFPSHDMIQACFEILGMDILIDSKMKPYILEVNHSPSFHTSEHVDKEVKEALIRDTLLILNLTQDIRKKVKRRTKLSLSFLYFFSFHPQRSSKKIVDGSAIVCCRESKTTKTRTTTRRTRTTTTTRSRKSTWTSTTTGRSRSHGKTRTWVASDASCPAPTIATVTRSSTFSRTSCRCTARRRQASDGRSARSSSGSSSRRSSNTISTF